MTQSPIGISYQVLTVVQGNLYTGYLDALASDTTGISYHYTIMYNIPFKLHNVRITHIYRSLPFSTAAGGGSGSA